VEEERGEEEDIGEVQAAAASILASPGNSFADPSLFVFESLFGRQESDLDP
jgi:hypothetical protein